MGTGTRGSGILQEGGRNCVEDVESIKGLIVTTINLGDSFGRIPEAIEVPENEVD